MGLGLEMGNPKGHFSYGHWYFRIPYDEIVRAVIKIIIKI